MTRSYDSTTKRAELIRAARELFHEQGFHKTSLDSVARRSGVPLGNVHYYFETKQALAEAVIASHVASLQEAFSLWEGTADPLQRLHQLVRAPLDAAESVIRYGCPQGSLCQELEKLGHDSSLPQSSARLLQLWVDWAGQQLGLLGRLEPEATELAYQLVASLQGTMLLAQAFRSPQMLASQLGRVEAWLDEILSRKKGA